VFPRPAAWYPFDGTIEPSEESQPVPMHNHLSSDGGVCNIVKHESTFNF
jgi:hypothetical protein